MNKAIKTGLILAALTAIIPIVACAPTRTTESTGQYVDDSVITSKVKNDILQDADLKVLQIHVNTYKGTVQLSGFVDSPQTFAKAGAVARAVEGVKAVQNDLAVK